MIAVGLMMMGHAGYAMMSEKRAAAAAGEDLAIIGFQVLFKVLLGAVLALWGGIGEFKPIRIADSKKPRWESLHARPDFHCYSNRAKMIRPILKATIPEAPPDMD